jgi:hypothetical protein
MMIWMIRLWILKSKIEKPNHSSEDSLWKKVLSMDNIKSARQQDRRYSYGGAGRMLELKLLMTHGRATLFSVPRHSAGHSSRKGD